MRSLTEILILVTGFFSPDVTLSVVFLKAAVKMCEYLLSVGVMLPLMAVLSAAWIEVDPESCTNTQCQFYSEDKIVNY